MAGPTRGEPIEALLLGCVTCACIAAGCAPTAFDRAIAYHAQRTGVTDAAARHTNVSPYYRFNAALLSDIDDALEQSSIVALRSDAINILREANALALATTANEIARMPAAARDELATRAGTEADTIALQQHFARLARAALENDLGDVDRLTQSGLAKKLKAIRQGVENLPDDRGRLARRLLLFWGAIPTAIGIAREESRLTEKCVAKANKKFDRIAVWRPIPSGQDALIDRYAPTIALEWPDNRHYDARCDRIGAVTLSLDGKTIDVRIDSSAPTVYAYTSESKIHQEVYRQLNYVWWFPERPEMTEHDVMAGHIDGAMLRITLDSHGRPFVIESTLNCGCAHEVFVSARLESAAHQSFGPALAGKRFAVERRVPGKHDVVVIDTFEVGSNATHPLVLSAAGYHEVYRIKFDAPESIDSLEIVEDASYRILDYDTLDRLPLGNGVASMFGPDGLVHHAGRPEGYLAAPSGMLSAGQPRQRGTQRVRWDDYLHDDPRLLEKTLRIPPHH